MKIFHLVYTERRRVLRDRDSGGGGTLPDVQTCTGMK